MADGRAPAFCAMVLSNVPGALGLDVARGRKVPVAVVDHRETASREEHDSKVIACLREAGVEVVCLAGYMRLLSPLFVRSYRGKILNIHPALLPSFPGLHVQRKALEHGVRWTGCTVHVVDEEVDHGPILLQAAVPILPGDTEESLSERILRCEHRTYAAALGLFCQGRFRLEGARTHLDMDRDEYRSLLKDLEGPGGEE